ncbi:MAG: stage II sporulation protein M [Eubacteriales bacterium]
MKKKIPFGGLVLCGCFFLGGLLGCMMANGVDESGQVALEDYLRTYLTLLAEDQIEPNFWNTAWSAIKPPLLAFLLGFSFLGVIGLPILFGIEGFLFTFSVSALGKLFGVEGLLPAFFLFCLPALLWVPILFLLGQQSFQAALTQIAKMSGRAGDKIYPTGYFRRALFYFFGVGILIILEYVALPSLLVAAAAAVIHP